MEPRQLDLLSPLIPCNRCQGHFFIVFELLARIENSCTPQATAVKLAQLGEELFPTVWGNVGIADKREGAEGKLPSAKQTGWNRSMDEK